MRSDTDDRTSEQRRADALVDLARRSLAHSDLPDVNGDRPHLAVTINWASLRDDIARTPASGDGQAEAGVSTRRSSRPVGGLTGGWLTGCGRHREPLTPEAVRRIGCDAQIIPAVLASDGQILDLGRTTPTWSVHQRRAAALRDGGCVFGGCRASLDRCQLHHIAHWAAHRGPPRQGHPSLRGPVK